MSMEKADVLKYLWAISTSSEIDELWGILKIRNNQLMEREVMKFRKGDNVKFITKRGREVSGPITAVNRKSISVKTENGTWRVSPSLLEKI